MTISLRAATGSFLAAMAILLAAPAAAQFGGPVPVRVAEAQTTTMSPTMQVAGTVISRADATLSAEVEGRLLEVAEVGTRVEEGDVLARIEDTRLKLEAQELAAEIQRAESRLEFLDAELARYRRLAERNLTAVTQIEQTRADRNVAASELEVARSRLAQVQDRIDRTRVRAPFPGVVVARLVQAGERVSVGADVVRLVDQDRLEVVARAPLAFYRYVAPGDELAIRVAEDWFIPAEVRTAVSVGDESSHVFELRLDVDERLPVGQTVRVTIPTASARDVLAVPRDALVLRGDGVAVFVVDEQGKAQRMRVEPGIGSEEWIEVSGPVQAGDRVVVRGNERLRAGQDVQVQEG
ncbi:MAG: efflux RND transporter periplasmic adaptor subunit [Wenzhouxiangellaceae bacterium]|nr:efflux RND transporter periplasmic adaptor subunit [Wenzhouxiangellaceae bacterium]